jgi:hypothetical protein
MHIARVLTVSALALTASIGVVSAQAIPPGRVYTFHSTAQAGCPALDWHIVVGGNNTLDGMIAWDSMKAMAHASGTLNPTAGTFTMQAHEVGGQGRTATVDGRVRPADGFLLANVHGPNITCTGITVPWFTPPPAGGGG